MPLFHYTAMSSEGALSEGTMEAADERAAVERIRHSGVIPLKLTAGKQSVRERIGSGVSKGDLQTFTAELAVLLGERLPLDKSLGILAEISESAKMRRTIQSTLKAIREGSSFSEALSRHQKIFPRFYVNMIKAGEAGGVLDEVLDKLTEFIESSRELKEHVFSAMIYPTILIVAGIASIIVLIAFVLPRFSNVLKEMGGQVPVAAQAVISVSGFLQDAWWIILAAAVAGGLMLRNHIRSDGGRYQWDALKLRLMQDVIRKLETARFCRTLGTLLKSGVPLLQALDNSKAVVNNRVIASAIDGVAKGAKEGKGITLPLTEARVLPPLALSLIKVGEETGRLDSMLIKIAVTYERSLKEAIKRLVSFLEPALILFMGLLIGFIVISMLTAIFSITDLPF